GFQAGSTFKIFTAAAAIEAGISTSKSFASPQTMTVPSGTYFDCEGGGTGPWEVKNSTGSGTFDMVRGLRQSVNTYFAKLEEEVGLCETVEMAEKMGIKVPFKAADGSARPDNAVTPSFTLGTMDVST